MTVRQGKQLTWVFAAFAVLAIALDAVVVFVRHKPFEASDVVGPLMFLVLFITFRSRYARLEAAHGPDYVQPVPNKGVLIAIAVALGLIALALAAYIWIARR